tara:strand:- start:31 stop:828 length:798 start_codon:yes stop_codon:yes gene_type:complete
MKFKKISLFIILILFTLNSYSRDYIIVQSTTSIANTGLLDLLSSKFEKQTGIKVRPIAVGTGNAISNAKRGDGDVLMVHSKKDELKFVSDGFGVKRHELMYNNFIIVGPKDDPAKISQENDIKNIMKKISLSNQKFISRDDKSGTHIKENDLWKLANINLFDNRKYIKTGTSMANTLNVASEMNAYTLSDKGTWISFKNKNNLKILFEGGTEMHNEYGVIAINPKKFPHVEYDKSKEFIEWLITGAGKDVINNFTYNGEKLFFTN